MQLSEDEERSLGLFWRAYEAHRDAVQAGTEEVAREIPDFRALLDEMDPRESEAANARDRALQRAAIEDGEWEPYLAKLRQDGSNYAKMGIRFGAWYELLRAVRGVFADAIDEAYPEDPQDRAAAMTGLVRFIDIAMAEIGEAYIETKQDIIRSQQEAIREISTPVLQIRDGMLILPIIGMVDTYRARQLTEELLHAIRDRRARVVVMDITGVPVVDSRVANHFLQSVEAAKLMGARVIMTGVAPQIAQTLVTIGADLGDVLTVGDLQGGIEMGRRWLEEGAP